MSGIDEIERFILDELAHGKQLDALSPEADLLSLGIIDSLGITEIVGFLEARYGIQVSDDDLTPEHFQSLQSMQAFVQSKQAAGAGR